MERMGVLSVLMVWLNLNLILLQMNCVYADIEEGRALLAFKVKLRNPAVLDDWRDETADNPCTWKREHIACDDNGNVIRIILMQCGLIGEFAPELERLKKLEYINVAGNQMGGQILPQIGNIVTLQYLFLDGNNFTGTPPASLGQLLNLKSLTLNDNQLSGCVPLKAWGKMLSQLTFLDMKNNPGLMMFGPCNE